MDCLEREPLAERCNTGLSLQAVHFRKDNRMKIAYCVRGSCALARDSAVA
jgi:hypothetical protein